MANDQREQAIRSQEEIAQQIMTDNIGENPNPKEIAEWKRFGSVMWRENDREIWREGYDAAATAEGIPQADGWVDVADRLPAQSDLSGYLNDSVFTWSAVGGDDGWASVGRFDIEQQKFIGDGYVIAWMPIPEFSKR